jgi:hypothetical protein
MSKISIIPFMFSAFRKVGGFGKSNTLILVAFLYVFSTHVAFSQAGGEVYSHAALQKFACNAVQYQVTAITKGAGSVLWAYNPMLGTRTKIADLQVYVNAIGFNTKDNLIYGIMDNNEVVAIGSNGSIWRKVSSSGSHWSNLNNWGGDGNSDKNQDYFVGDVTDEGYLYIYSGSTNRYYIIDVDFNRTTTFGRFVNQNGALITAGSRFQSMNLPINVDDWAYNPTTGKFYGVTGSGTNDGADGNKLVSMTKSGTTDRTAAYNRAKLNNPGLGSNDPMNMRNNDGIWGAVFFDNTGSLWAAANWSGRFYRVQIDAFQSDGFSKAGSATQFNDGASCPAAAPLSLDYGDAPDSYGTTFTDVSLSAHIVSPDLKIGALVDLNQNGHPSANAKGDDENNQDDEDGIGYIAKTNVTPGTSYTIPVAVHNTTGRAAFLAGWLDWNENGIYDSYERAQIGVDNNQTSATLSWTVPTGIVSLGNRFLRLRIASNADQIAESRGLASNGEIEDHIIGLTPLPVTLAALSAQNNENGISLRWKTVMEENFSHFEVQRSADGKTFAPIGLGSGSNGIYDFFDHAPLNGVNYYRLKMLDLDGTFALSRIVKAKSEKNKHHFLVENPVKGGGFTVNTDAENPTFELYSLSGKRISLQSEKGNAPTAYNIKIKKQIPGLYIIKMSSEDQVLTQKIIVE